MAKQKAIEWHSEVVKVADLIENPNNPKKPDARGRKRLIKSLNKFGVVIGGICNSDNMLIDGHSRKDVFIEMGITEVEVRKPNRPLTESEYRDMNAVFDLAKAGQTDYQVLEEVMTDDFFEEWDIDRFNEPAGNGNGGGSGDGDQYHGAQQWFLNIRCESEQHAQQLYEKFTEQGLDVKIVT